VTTAALAATAALALAACGGGGGSGDSDKIASSPTATSTAAATTPPTPTGGAPLKIDPSLALPADLKVTFTWPTPANSAQAAALSSAANYIQAIDHAVVKQNKNDPPLRAYAADDALAYAQSFVQENVAAKLTVTGTDSYYRPVLSTLGGGDSIDVKLCNNQSKVYSKEIATGKVNVTPVDDRSYVLYDIVMVKLPTAHAIWQAHSITVKEKSLQCKQ
jgi:hypothetical protein